MQALNILLFVRLDDGKTKREKSSRLMRRDHSAGVFGRGSSGVAIDPMWLGDLACLTANSFVRSARKA